MLVYRWETEDGEGAYAVVGSWDMREVSGVPHDAEHGRPMFHEDPGFRDQELCGEHFAFASREQEARWFRESERRVMRERGVSLRTYEVPGFAVRLGHYQCVFDRSCAERVA